jgi:hypothetical protein
MLSANCQVLNLGFPVSKPAIANFIQSFIAVVAGNVVYFLLMPYLPPAARHNVMKLDLGVIIDFWFCLVFLGAIKTAARWRKSSGEEQHRS